MRKFPVIIFCSLLAVLSLQPTGVSGQAADFNVQLLDERNQIRTSNIRRVARDKNGFLWILSPRYLQRFDGQQVKIFDTSGEDLLDIAVDLSGDIWVSTQSGIKRFVNDFTGFEDIPVIVGQRTKFNCLQVSSDNTVWIISGIGLFRLDRKTSTFKYHLLPGFENQLFYRRLFTRYGDEFFIGDTHTLFAYNPLKQTVRTIGFEDAGTITALSGDRLWVTNSHKQVFEVDFATGQKRLIDHSRFKPSPASPFLEIIGAVPLDAGNVLATTNQGCFIYNTAPGIFRRATTYYYGAEFPVNEIYFSYFDREGMLWLVNQQGILFMRPLEHGFHWRNDLGSQGRGIIYAISGDKQGNIWLGTATGLVKYNPGNGKAEARYPGPGQLHEDNLNHSVRGLACDEKYIIFGAYAGGIQLYDPALNRLRRPVYPEGPQGTRLRQEIEKDHIYNIHKLTDGRFLILGDLNCYLLSPGSYQLRKLEFSGSDYILQSAAETSAGHLWMSSYRGLLYLNRDFETLHQDTLFHPNRLVSSIVLKNDSTVWAGSTGLFEVSVTSGGLKKKNLLPALKNQQITTLFKDPSDKLWIGTDKGLCRFTPATGKLEWFDLWDNLQNKQLNPGSLYYAPGGRLYLGGNSGLNYFDPLAILPRKEALRVLITEIKISHNDSILLKTSPGPAHLVPEPGTGSTAQRNSKALELAWNQNSVEINFSTPYFRNPQKLQYRYRMKGLDSSWVWNGANNNVRFSSLPPGHYTFSAATSSDGIEWYETSGPFQFYISPPIWKRAWFVVLMISLFTGTAYWLVKKRIAGIRRRESQVYTLQNRAHSLEKEKALAMYEGLRQQLNPHFLFNSLTSLGSLIRIDQKLAGEFLDGLSKTYRYILKNRDHELVPLHNEIKFAETFVSLQKTRFEDGLEVIFPAPGREDHLLIAPVTLQNLIENAIKHNVVSPESPLIIEISLEEDYLVVRNNRQKKNFVETSNRQGLSNLKSLYGYLCEKPLEIIETSRYFVVRIPLIRS